MADVRTQQARERVALALTWAPHRPGKGGFADGIAALDELADLVAVLETALREAVTHIGIDRSHHDHMCTYELVETATEADCDCGYRIVLMYREIAGAAAEPETHK